MTAIAKLRLSCLCIILAWVMMLSSGLLLCACPGWPAIGMAAAALAIWLRKDGQTLAPVLALIACFAMTCFHLWEKFEMPGSRSARTHETVEKIKRMQRERQAAQDAATNQMSPATSK